MKSTLKTTQSAFGNMLPQGGILHALKARFTLIELLVIDSHLYCL